MPESHLNPLLSPPSTSPPRAVFSCLFSLHHAVHRTPDNPEYWTWSALFNPDSLVLMYRIAGLGVFAVNFLLRAKTIGFAGGTLFMLVISILAALQRFYGQTVTAKRTATVALLHCAQAATVLLVLDFVLHGHPVVSVNALLPLSLLLFLVLACDWLFLGANEVLARNGMLFKVIGCPLLLFFLAYLDFGLRQDSVDVPLLLGLTWFVVMILLFSAMHRVDNRRALYLPTILLIEYSATIGATVSLVKVVRSSKPHETLRVSCALLLIILGTSTVHAIRSTFESDLRFLPSSNDRVRGMYGRESGFAPSSNCPPIEIWSAIAISILGAVISALGLLYYPQFPRALACMPVFLVSTALSVTFYLLPQHIFVGCRYDKISRCVGVFLLISTSIAVVVIVVGIMVILSVLMCFGCLFLCFGCALGVL